MHTVIPIRALKDSYIWLIQSANGNDCLIVDPGEAKPVIDYIEKAHLTPRAILITHHHYDHTDGIPALVKKYQLPVYGSAKETISHQTHFLQEADEITFPECDFKAKILSIPGHTLGHIAYLTETALFCGDTLFSAGCGYPFEGTVPQLRESLARLAELPDETKVYCAHEYTLENLYEALQKDPDNIDVQKHLLICLKKTQQNLPTLPSTIGLEKKINPCLWRLSKSKT